MYTEGSAKFVVGNAFYRPTSQIARDLGVIAAAIYRSDTGHLRVLDAMAGCGVRSLRYWQESQADWVWLNEGNPDLSPIVQQNLRDAIASGCCQITHLDANQIFFDCYNRSDYYDLVDVDGFGSPAPYLGTSLWAVKIGGLLYLTSTDGRTATGHSPSSSLSVYGAYARNHPAAHEQGLRLLIGAVQQQAAAKGLGIEPVFSLFLNATYRVMLRLIKNPSITAQNYGFIGYCQHCGSYQVVSWRQLGRVVCAHDKRPLTLSGPMWLGALHSRQQLKLFVSLAQHWKWFKCLELLQLMEAEVDLPPYFYTFGEIGRRGKIDIPKRDRLIQGLQEQGYRASLTHIDAQAIKTNADLPSCIAVARHIMSG
ncbi:MAG TPA: tRNA (guanine-N1)-methyltransferase [Cyanobacteria bacterium UBA8803]|nr:tRNA (guanine-N1)-methyltransferase [Cyanobacteria bacterium UBA9273]HBL59352.1 tRNA (guanine-N1)-methyltransferase [Cyanobacteria bacterium UBA8803]